MILEILKRFCSKAEHFDNRKWMLSPCQKDGVVISTNGRILIRVPMFEEAREFFEITMKLPDFDKYSSPEKFVSIPALPDPLICGVCKGTGKATECPDCDGEGEFTHGRNEYHCQECDGDGQLVNDTSDGGVVCFQCEGIGYKWQDVAINDALFDERYLRLIRDLPNIEIGTNGAELSAYFKCDIGDGFLMPRRKS